MTTTKTILTFTDIDHSMTNLTFTFFHSEDITTRDTDGVAHVVTVGDFETFAINGDGEMSRWLDNGEEEYVEWMDVPEEVLISLLKKKDLRDFLLERTDPLEYLQRETIELLPEDIQAEIVLMKLGVFE